MVSSSGWVMSASQAASHQRRHSSGWRLSRAMTQPMMGASSVCQNSAWLSERCSVMLRMASPWSAKASRSGSVPNSAPQAADFQRAVRRPMTATPTAAPSAS